MTNCNTCWGTGRYKGWGGPCAEGCPMLNKKQGLEAAEDVSLPLAKWPQMPTPEMGYDEFMRAKGAKGYYPKDGPIPKDWPKGNDPDDEFLAPKVFPTMKQPAPKKSGVPMSSLSVNINQTSNMNALLSFYDGPTKGVGHVHIDFQNLSSIVALKCAHYDLHIDLGDPQQALLTLCDMDNQIKALVLKGIQYCLTPLDLQFIASRVRDAAGLIAIDLGKAIK